MPPLDLETPTLRPASPGRIGARHHQPMPDGAMVRPHGPPLPLRVGTRGSPLALWQTRDFLGMITRFCPLLRQIDAFQEHVIATTGDRIQDRRLADVGGKGLFAKEIHEALNNRRDRDARIVAWFRCYLR